MRQWCSLEEEKKKENHDRKTSKKDVQWWEKKKHLVELLNHGKPRNDFIRKYDLTASAFDIWASSITATGSSREKDNRTIEKQELIKLCKENQQLRMDDDVLVQAELIFARK